MDHYFWADIKAAIDMPEEYFAFICQAAAHHYDATVLDMVAVGGFLYGQKGRRDFMKKTHPDQALQEEVYTFRQIDLMCKAIEFPATAMGWEITREFKQVLDGINQKSKYINNLLHPDE